jgi:predicted nucleic acid-binding protein
METHTGLARRVTRAAIARFRTTVFSSALLHVETVDAFVEELAWKLFLRYDDKGFSMMDCTSFAGMQQLGLRRAFTFDRHRAQAGFEPLPRLP